MLGIAEAVRGSLVDWNGHCPGGRVIVKSGMYSLGFKFHSLFIPTVVIFFKMDLSVGPSFTQVAEIHKLVTYLVGNPNRLVGIHFNRLHFLVAANTGYQVMPGFIINQVDIREI